MDGREEHTYSPSPVISAGLGGGCDELLRENTAHISLNAHTFIEEHFSSSIMQGGYVRL